MVEEAGVSLLACTLAWHDHVGGAAVGFQTLKEAAADALAALNAVAPPQPPSFPRIQVQSSVIYVVLLLPFSLPFLTNLSSISAKRLILSSRVFLSCVMQTLLD